MKEKRCHFFSAASLAGYLAVAALLSGCESSKQPLTNTPSHASLPAPTQQVKAKENSSQIPAFLQKFPHDAYHKLLSGNQVVGKTVFHWSVDQDKLRFDEDSDMKITLFKKSQLISTESKTWTNAKLEIQKLLFKMKSDSAFIEISGERLSNQLQLKITQAGQTQTKSLAIEEPTLMSSTIRPFLLMKGLPSEPLALSPLMLEPSALTTVPVSLKVSKMRADLWKVDFTYLQHQMLSEMTGNGSLLSEKSDFAGLSIVAKPSSAAELKNLFLEGTQSDLVELAKVQFPTLLHSQQLKKLSVKISGVDLHTFELNRHRQTLNGDILTAEVENLPKETLPVQSLVGQQNIEIYLQGDAMTEVYDPVIQKQAREIVGTESDLWKRALLIKDFVYRELKKEATISIPNALEILQTKKGDCNEHAVLYTALARAAGIPTRPVVGLVYSGSFNGGAGFYYHAWVEVFAGKEWVAIDPTWNQVPADATHLAFVEGGLDQQVQVTSLMGKIKLSLVSSF
ncbi:MAG: hypothetical protein JWQ35_1574 [Bacteriovoracaceae bacterium]|nr:hypothetical protein [Bacteriovoracaceae bacterium]